MLSPLLPLPAPTAPSTLWLEASWFPQVNDQESGGPEPPHSTPRPSAGSEHKTDLEDQRDVILPQSHPAWASGC